MRSLLQLQGGVVVFCVVELAKTSTKHWWKLISPDNWGRQVLLSEFAEHLSHR